MALTKRGCSSEFTNFFLKYLMLIFVLFAVHCSVCASAPLETIPEGAAASCQRTREEILW